MILVDPTLDYSFLVCGSASDADIFRQMSLAMGRSPKLTDNARFIATKPEMARLNEQAVANKNVIVPIHGVVYFRAVPVVVTDEIKVQG